MEEAKKADKPVVLYVETRSDERRYRNAREACEELEEDLFQNYEVASRMNDHFTLIRVELEDLDRSTMRRYGIRSAPQLILFDSEVERPVSNFSGSNIRASQVVRGLDQVKERNDQLLERQERQERRASR